MLKATKKGIAAHEVLDSAMNLIGLLRCKAELQCLRAEGDYREAAENRLEVVNQLEELVHKYLVSLYDDEAFFIRG